MRCVFALLVLWISTTSCQYDIGDPCPEDAEPPTGVCKRYEDCPNAIHMVDVLKKKLTYCSIEDSIKVVCCFHTLKTTIPSGTGDKILRNRLAGNDDNPIEMDFLEALRVGTYRTDNTVCRYDGNYPMTCYRQEYPRPTTVPERELGRCPDLQWPDIEVSSLSPQLQVAWEACRVYSLERSQCIPSPTNPGEYNRDDCLDQYLSPKVADGEPAQILQFPHMAVLGITDSSLKKNKKIIWYGGGSLISEYFVLTAGHVLVHPDQKIVEYAMLGATNKTDLKSGVIFQVVRTISHPQYSIIYKYHDIALLELDRRVRFTEFMRPICLRVPGLKITAERSIAGWGKIGYKKKDSPILLKARIFEKQTHICEKAVKGQNFKWDPVTLLCAGANDVGTGKRPDTCQGDSGGPLMSKIKNLPCSHVVVGVVSWGPKCDDGKPGIYANVGYVGYLEWITGTVWPDTVQQ